MEDVQYVGFERRLFAAIIDSVWTTLIMAPVVGGLDLIFGFHKKVDDIDPEALAKGMVSPEQFSDLINSAATSMTLQLVVLTVIILTCWLWKYSTPGKAILRIEIVDEKTFATPTKKQLIIRYLGYFVSMIPLGLGFIFISFNKKRQGFHDKIAGTVVIRMPKKPKVSENNVSQ